MPLWEENVWFLLNPPGVYWVLKLNNIKLPVGSSIEEIS